ncbi:hypothetical protein WMY93_019561 [Mugilogobius chulae]|uniref:Uncharacterized protein n=1 Tax=Mugilogobius chulae TaxID=88201 RepID=A0AAW0NFP1_9GOBI
MAAGASGAAFALLSYCLLLNILKPDDVVWTQNSSDINYQRHANNSIFAFEDLSHKQTNHVKAKVGFGKYALAMAFIYPSLYKRLTKRMKPPARLQVTRTLIIAICLMISGDIHPCPGPSRATLQEQINTLTEGLTLHSVTEHTWNTGGEAHAVAGTPEVWSTGALPWGNQSRNASLAVRPAGALLERARGTDCSWRLDCGGSTGAWSDGIHLCHTGRQLKVSPVPRTPQVHATAARRLIATEQDGGRPCAVDTVVEFPDVPRRDVEIKRRLVVDVDSRVSDEMSMSSLSVSGMSRGPESAQSSTVTSTVRRVRRKDARISTKKTKGGGLNTPQAMVNTFDNAKVDKTTVKANRGRAAPRQTATTAKPPAARLHKQQAPNKGRNLARHLQRPADTRQQQTSAGFRCAKTPEFENLNFRPILRHNNQSQKAVKLLKWQSLFKTAGGGFELSSNTRPGKVNDACFQRLS